MGEKVVPIELEEEIDEAEIVKFEYDRTRKTILKFNSYVYGPVVIVVIIAMALIGLRVYEFSSELHRMENDNESGFLEDLSIDLMKMAIFIWITVGVGLFLAGPLTFLLMIRAIRKKGKQMKRNLPAAFLNYLTTFNVLLIASGIFGLVVNLYRDPPILRNVYFFILLISISGSDLLFNILSIIRMVQITRWERREIQSINLGSMGTPLEL